MIGKDSRSRTAKRPHRWSALATVLLTLALSAVICVSAFAGKRPGYITGTAKTECGKPLPKFKVAAYGFDGNVNVNPDGLPFLGQTTGRGGRYALQTKDSIHQRKPVKAMVRSVEAQTTLSAQGHRYTFSLYPTDGKPNGTGAGDFKAYSAKGIVRNFVLRTSGLKPGEGAYRGRETEGDDSAAGAFYGGNLILDLSFYPQPGQQLTVTLVPAANLVDGCAAHTIVRTADLGKLNSSYVYLHSIPLTGYTLTVKLNGAVLPLHRLGQSGSASSLPVSFPPTPELPDGSSAVSIEAG